jgi:hypothetical protein
LQNSQIPGCSADTSTGTLNERYKRSADSNFSLTWWTSLSSCQDAEIGVHSRNIMKMALHSPVRASSDSLFLPRPRPRRKRGAVQFGHVEIYEFAPAIGHNPSVTAGVPITLSDRPIKSLNFDLVDYEHHRRGHRRPTRQLFLPKEIREQMYVT